MWLTRDKTLLIHVINQFRHEPKESHLQGAYRILYYLKDSLGKRILFKKNGRRTLEANTDVDYACSLIDRISTTGYCTFLSWSLVAKNKV